MRKFAAIEDSEVSRKALMDLTETYETFSRKLLVEYGQFGDARRG